MWESAFHGKQQVKCFFCFHGNDPIWHQFDLISFKGVETTNSLLYCPDCCFFVESPWVTVVVSPQLQPLLMSILDIYQLLQRSKRGHFEEPGKNDGCQVLSPQKGFNRLGSEVVTCLFCISNPLNIVNLNVTRFKEVHVQIVMSYPFAMLLMFICCNLGPSVIISLLAVSKRFLLPR